MPVETRHEVALRFIAPARMPQDELRRAILMALEILKEVGMRDVSVRFLGKGKNHDQAPIPPTGKL
jgi:hypothetical protein